MVIGIGLLTLALAASATGAYAAPTPPPQAKGVIRTAGGDAIGNVLLTQLPDGSVAISAEVKNLPPGQHGVTLRERGACAPNFDAAGATVLSQPITVRPDGGGTLTANTTAVRVAAGEGTVLDSDGTAVVITALEDEQNKVACAVLEPVPVPSPVGNTSRASAEFKTSVGETVGNATLTQAADGSVRVQVQVRGLPPGEHAIHFHQFGQCAPTFGAAGEHHNPFNTLHGNVPGGPHSGDLPNMVVGADGTGSFDYTSRLVTLTPSDQTLLDSDGSTLIIHERADDYASQPSGNAGGRIACAVIQPAAAQAPPPAAGQPPAQGQPPAAGQPPAQGQPGVPSQLPNTAGPNSPIAPLLLAGLLLLAAGLVLMRRGLRARG
ncbi:MAG: hypothetical protein OHK0022_42470 [Roseiflexaceae bacterium]